MRVLTCNVRCYGAADGPNHWDLRKDLCLDVIRSQEADLIGCQEVWGEQYRDLKAGLPEYESFGLADDVLSQRPVNTVWYRRDRFECVSASGYWLSETPHLAGSRSWESSCVRLATWVRLLDRESGAEFRWVNTHLDHRSQPAREGQAGVIVADGAVYPEDYPQLLTGDLNANEKNPALQVLREAGWRDTYAQIHGKEDAGLTIHHFEGPKSQAQNGRIDWIMVKGPWKVTAARVIDDHREGRYPSDHYFMSADVELG